MSVRDTLRKTRLNQQTLLLLLAGVVAVVYAILGASLYRQHLDQGKLSSQLDSAQVVLANADGVQQDLEELPARLDAAEQELAAAEVAFPSELDSNSILQTVLGYAGESGVRVMSADALPPAAESEGETEGPTTLAFGLQIEGDLAQLIAFLEALEEGVASTTRIESFSLQAVDGPYAVDIELVAYARSSTVEVSSQEGEVSTGEGTEAAGDPIAEAIGEGEPGQ